MFPAVVDCRGAVHDAGGTGGCQRSRPTGGAAYGIPRYEVTPFAVNPQTGPLAVWTEVSAEQAGAMAAAAGTVAVTASVAVAEISVTAATAHTCLL